MQKEAPPVATLGKPLWESLPPIPQNFNTEQPTHRRHCSASGRSTKRQRSNQHRLQQVNSDPEQRSLPHWELQLASKEVEQPYQITLRGQFPFLRPHRTTAPPRSLIGLALNTNSPPLGHRSLLSSLKNLSSGSLFLTNPTNCASHTLINLSQPRLTPV